MHGRYSVFALIVATLLALSGALGASQFAGQSGSVPPPAQITFTGRVTNSQGRPVEGAGVTLYGMAYSEEASLPKVEAIQEKVTGADGAFSLTSTQGANPYRPGFLIARKEGLALGWAMARTQADRQFDIVLGEPKDLAGEVVDEKGQPVADGEVSIAFAVKGRAEDRRFLAVPGFLNAKTDNNGHFLFTNLPAEATFEFLVRKPGRVTLSTFAQTIFSGSSRALDIVQMVSGQSKCQFSPGQTGIKLTLPLEARIEGVVVEKTTGKPVGGVKVTTHTDQEKSGFLPPDPVTVADDGTFRIGGLAAGDHTVRLATTREDAVEWVAEPVPVSLKADETKSGIRLVVTKGGTIEVLVKDADGQPVERAVVHVSHTHHRQYFGGSTNEEGLARIRVPAGSYHVSEPFRPGYTLQIRREQVTIEEGQTQRVEFALRVTPKVSGTVRDGAGNPLAGAKIQIMPSTGGGVVTDADGKFAMSWDPGPLKLPDTAFVLVARDLSRNLAEAVAVDEEMDNLDLRLKPGAVLTGTVLNQEGKPLSGARILIHLQQLKRGAPTPAGLLEEIVTAENGTFRIQAIPPERRYRVSAMANGYGAQEVDVHASNLLDDRQDLGQFRLPLANLSISGIVVNSDGKPVPDATVRTVDGSLPPRGDVRTDAEGKFVIKGVPAGSILLIADTRGPKYMHGFIQANGGATGVRIVVSE